MSKRRRYVDCVDLPDPDDSIIRHFLETGEGADRVIETHAKLAITIAGEFAVQYPQFEHDFASDALFTLVSSVESFRVNHRDDNFAAYISSKIRWFLRNQLERKYLHPVLVYEGYTLKEMASQLGFSVSHIQRTRELLFGRFRYLWS